MESAPTSVREQVEACPDRLPPDDLTAASPRSPGRRLSAGAVYAGRLLLPVVVYRMLAGSGMPWRQWSHHCSFMMRSASCWPGSSIRKAVSNISRVSA
jgi:hypothetical protein